MTETITPIIDPEFRDLLPQHTPEELDLLDKAVQSDPNHESMPPILVWEGENIIVDGNNQFQLRQKHGLTVRTRTLNFASREEAIQHALEVQCARRNLDPSRLAMVLAKLPGYSHGGDRKSDQAAKFPLEDLGKKFGVSEKTIRTAGKVCANGAAALIQGVNSGRFAVSDAASVISLPHAEQVRIIAKARKQGTTLSSAKKISGGITFDPVELEAAPSRKPPKNGQSVLDGKSCAVATALLSKLCRELKKLDLFDKHNSSLSEMLRDVRELQRVASTN